MKIYHLCSDVETKTVIRSFQPVTGNVTEKLSSTNQYCEGNFEGEGWHSTKKRFHLNENDGVKSVH
jgi:hypothetical protein